MDYVGGLDESDKAQDGGIATPFDEEDGFAGDLALTRTRDAPPLPIRRPPDISAVDGIRDEIVEVAARNSKFEAFTDEHASAAAKALPRDGVSAIEALRTTGE